MNQAEELIGRLNKMVSEEEIPFTGGCTKKTLDADDAYKVIRRYFTEQSDKSTKLITAWAEVMGDLSAKAVNGMINLDDTKKTISHYIGSVLDEISGERGD